MSGRSFTSGAISTIKNLCLLSAGSDEVAFSGRFVFWYSGVKITLRGGTMRITVIGTGYVGLVTGTCLADAGHDVVCVDIDETKINKLRKGETPIYEPELSEVIQRASK